MAVLRFTAAGAVPTPTVVQIRVTKNHSGRVSVGLPEPTRALTDDEVRANIHYFARELRGGRSVPCEELVLAGSSWASPESASETLAYGRAMGLRRIILHLGREGREGWARAGVAVDEVVIAWLNPSDVGDIALLSASGLRVVAVVVLDRPGLNRLSEGIQPLIAAGPARLTFTWPLQGEAPPPVAEVLAPLRAAVASADAAGVPVAIRGLPSCAVGDLATFAGKARNRWYVDVDHQRAEALLFFPDVVRMGRRDPCRFCSIADRCDGAPETWLTAGLVPPFQPVPAEAGPGVGSRMRFAPADRSDTSQD